MQIDPSCVLYIDDDVDDLSLFGHYMVRMYPDLRVLEAEDGQDGVDLLEKMKQENTPYPYRIILDINMPRMDGRETLQYIRNRPEWNDINVVMFTTSSSATDIAFCQNYGVECITKPMDFANLNHTIRQLLGREDKQHTH